MMNDEELSKRISHNMRKYRILNGLTQAQFSEMLSIDTQYYAQMERGERPFSIDKIALACNLFKLNIDDIIVLDQDDEARTKGQESHRQDLIIDITNNLGSFSLYQLMILRRYMKEVLSYDDGNE